MTTTTLFSALSLWLFLAIALANLGFSYATIGQWANQTKTRCIPMEREALLEFKKHLVDPSNRLATWDPAAADCCSWYGVSCGHHLGDSTAQYVTGLHLRSLSEFEFYDSHIDDYGAYRKTIFGGKVSSSLLSLKHLRYLDLSCNDFGGINIPSFLGSMRSLRYLNLSNAHFGGVIPHQLGNLSNLQYLNLDISRYYTYPVVDNLQWMSDLSSLKFLNLGGWNLSKFLDWDKVILTTLPSLLQLHLSNCQLPSPQPHSPNNNYYVNASSISILDLSENYINSLKSPAFLNLNLNSLNIEDNDFQGPIPRELKNLSSLREVYLGLNEFNSSVPNWLYGSYATLKVLSLQYNRLTSFQPWSSSNGVKNVSSLSILDLSTNMIEGPIPNEIQNMTSLRMLFLSSNNFISSIPGLLDGLTRLEVLDLSDNYLEAKFSSANWNMPFLISLNMYPRSEGSKLELEGGIPKSFKNSCNLRELNLRGVKLRQDINQVFEILSLPGCSSNGLEDVRLANCELSGNLATTNQHFGRLTSLKHLDLSLNKLGGTLPVSLGKFEKLEELYLDGNSLTGEVSEAHFENLKSLQYFVASGNQLKLRVSPDWISPFDQLHYLELRSWHIGPQLPIWLQSLESLEILDLSNSSIHGPLPLISSNLSVLDLSDNSFSGSISNFLCPPNFNSSGMQGREVNMLHYLNLDGNSLHGEIPNCFAAWPSLVVIKLGNNKFNGTIPESIGTLQGLQSLHLNNNSLSGELPWSLNKCTRLITIDVAENELVGSISTFTSAQTFLSMKNLILRSNKLSGPIPEKLCDGKSLIILDLANNAFDGTIPSCLGNLSAMAKMNEFDGVIIINYDENDVKHPETAVLRLKQYMQEYTKNLGLVRSLDLSDNKLCGMIPDEITGLSAMLSLNLSHNTLSGRIPKKIGSMQKLESMDLSSNQLSGEIPRSLSNLTYLAVLNLSHNRLSGRIPFGNQLQTFDVSSFTGNELCGSPLPNNCSNDVVPNEANDAGSDDEDGMIWFYASMTFGFVGGFWCFVGPLLLNRHWRFAYSQFLDRMWEKIWWILHRFGMF